MIPFAGRTSYSYPFPVYKCDKIKLNSILQLNLNAAWFFSWFFWFFFFPLGKMPQARQVYFSKEEINIFYNFQCFYLLPFPKLLMLLQVLKLQWVLQIHFLIMWVELCIWDQKRRNRPEWGMSQIAFSASNSDYQIQRHIVQDCSSIKINSSIRLLEL